MDTDLLLIRRMKNGDEDAVDAFVRKYYPVILRYCQFHIPDADYAEDMDPVAASQTVPFQKSMMHS